MAFRFNVLGSGSGGNATLLHITESERDHYFLIDAGIRPKDAAQRLDAYDVSLAQLDGIIITHMHTDHFRDTWCKPCRTHNIHIYFHQQHARLFWKLGVYNLDTTEFRGRLALTPETIMRSVSLPHDQQCSTGLLFEHGGKRFGFLTDLGHAPNKLFTLFQQLDVLAIESNYDPPLQRASPRPRYLKQRIMGERGHLSNQQALTAVKQFAQEAPLETIVLLHLSEQCNSPAHILELYEEQAPELIDKLVFSHQKTPTGWLTFVS